MIVYLETSVLLRKLFRQPHGIKDWDSWDIAVTSELTEVESFRNIDRLRLDARIGDDDVAVLSGQIRAVMERVTTVELSRAILKRAGEALPTVVGTLDAIHLVTALSWRAEAESRRDMVFLTHDDQLKRAARAMGFEVAG